MAICPRQFIGREPYCSVCARKPDEVCPLYEQHTRFTPLRSTKEQGEALMRQRPEWFVSLLGG